MDLASGANKLIVTMTHCDRNGNAKVVSCCNLPLTARKAVDLLITDLAVFDFSTSCMRLVKLLPGVTEVEVRAKTTADYTVALGNRRNEGS